jgi:hypothetical protein
MGNMYENKPEFSVLVVDAQMISLPSEALIVAKSDKTKTTVTA